LTRGRGAVSLIAAALLLVVVMAAAIVLGTEPVSVARAISEPSLDRVILVDVRTPRVLLAALAGGALSAVGAAYQALLRNPLAEPFVLGVSGGAALGATLVIVLGPALAVVIGLDAVTIAGPALIPAAALCGGLAATALVHGMARGAPEGSGGTSVLLAGVMVNSIAAALITFIKTLVSPSRAQQLLRWLTGFIDLPSSAALAAAAAYVAVGCAVLLADAGRLNLLALGDDAASSLGVEVRALQRRVFLACSCVVGAVVSLTGLIGFVGLIVPHAVRRIVGPDHRVVLPLSILVGAAALCACDLGARLAFRWLGTEPPVGAVTAILGGPAFLWLLRRSRAA
jgi:iron complex transport system permease protein